eukprot:708603-Alexandrium_andersonii.AAC.1
MFASKEGCRQDKNEAYFWGYGGQHVFQVACERTNVVWSDPTQMRGPPLRMLNNCSRVFRELWNAEILDNV